MKNQDNPYLLDNMLINTYFATLKQLYAEELRTLNELLKIFEKLKEEDTDIYLHYSQLIYSDNA